MMHPNDGEFRAYHDHELSAEQIRRVEEHLEVCPDCRLQSENVLTRAQQVDEYLLTLQPGSDQNTSVQAARTQLASRLSRSEKENETMSSKFLKRIPRAAWIGLTVFLVLAISLTFAPVQAIANSFLGLFRVEQITVVQIDPGNVPDESGTVSELESILSNNVQIEGLGEPQEVVSLAEANAQMDIPVRLPAGYDGDMEIAVQPGGSVSLEMDLELVNTVLYEMGRSDIELPEELDGAMVELEIPDGVVAQLGECSYAEPENMDPDEPRPQPPPVAKCTTLIQMPSPTISAPPSLNIAQVGEAYLQILGMTREEAANFARNVDWATTFVIPIPRYSADYYDVQIDGVTGTLIKNGYGSHYIYLWVKDGVVYALSGSGDVDDGLDMANSLQ